MVWDDLAEEADVLQRVNVRLVREAERAGFDFPLQRDHYLHQSTLVGQALRCVAEVDGRWVALITFSAPALHVKGRERSAGARARARAGWGWS
jgi:hypothetical protein